MKKTLREKGAGEKNSVLKGGNKAGAYQRKLREERSE